MKKMFITGGTGGIGTTLSIKFIKNGYQVVSTHNNKTDEFLNNWKNINGIKDNEITFINCDITNTFNTQDTISNILDKHEIDVLINNAGITEDSTFLKMNLSQWVNVLNVNLLSIFSVTQPIALQMVSRGKGCIINISSINGLKGQFGQTNYSASKSGILGFTKSLAMELASKGIRVNAICPGYSNTDMVEKMPAEVLKKIVNSIPTGKLIGTDEIANTAFFIAESMPSLTGETISVNGGQYMS